jgi:hypothetical protein
MYLFNYDGNAWKLFGFFKRRRGIKLLKLLIMVEISA